VKKGVFLMNFGWKAARWVKTGVVVNGDARV